MFDSNSMANQDVTPGITKQEFEKRREKYVEFLTNYQNYCFNNKKNSAIGANIKVDELGKNFIAIIPSNMTTFMAPDVPYTFKQNSDFLYLTGFKEPNSLLVISRTSRNNNSYTVALFVREKDSKKEVWEGAFTGPENIKKLCGIEKSFELNELESYISGLLNENENKKIVLWRYPTDELLKEESTPNCYNEFVEETINKIYAENCDKMILSSELNENTVLNTSRYFVQLARIKKSKAEIDIMRRSCDIASDAFIKTMLASHPGCNESLIYAKFDYETRIRGADHLAYIPVIAGGPRSTILHYIRNNQIISNNHMLLMDAGCLYRDYVSDITRTWPINGRFNGPQRDLYEACLNVQLYCLDKCRKGISISKLYALMINKIAEQLILLGLIKANQVDLTSDRLNFTTQKVVSRFCPHDIGHYLGLDVHDSPEIGKSIELDTGTVITIEPGKFMCFLFRIT
jgi:Xaa-Pro aminopeptidase